MTVSADFQASVNTQLNAQLSAAGSQAASYVQQQTGVDVTNARTAAGAAAAAQLASNGFDPTNEQSRQAMVAVIAGGLALIPGVGPILGGALETLYQIAQPIACPTAAFFHAIGISQSDCNSPPCSTTGTVATPQSIWNGTRVPPAAKVKGSFAQVVWGALVSNAASAMACKSAIPPGLIVDAVVAQWNATHQGPQTPVFVPPLSLGGTMGVYTTPTVPLIREFSVSSGNPFASSGGIDPNVYYAFATKTPWGLNVSKVQYIMPSEAPRLVVVNLGPPTVTHVAVFKGLSGLAGRIAPAQALWNALKATGCNSTQVQQALTPFWAAYGMTAEGYYGPASASMLAQWMVPGTVIPPPCPAPVAATPAAIAAATPPNPMKKWLIAGGVAAAGLGALAFLRGRG